MRNIAGEIASYLGKVFESGDTEIDTQLTNNKLRRLEVTLMYSEHIHKGDKQVIGEKRTGLKNAVIEEINNFYESTGLGKEMLEQLQMRERILPHV